MPTGIYTKTKQHCENISRALTNKKHSKEAIKNQVNSRKVNCPNWFKNSEETGNKISNAKRGKTYEQIMGITKAKETKLKQSKTRKGKSYEEMIGSKEKAEQWKKKITEKYIDTKPELIIDTILKELNVNYEKQKYSLKGTPDRFIKPNICIFADGDYWHNLPGRQKYDKQITEILQSQGYKVLRFWEHDIKNDKKLVKSKIQEMI